MSEHVKGLSEENTESSKKTDFLNVTGNFLTDINYKISIFIFFIGILIFSDIFISNILSKFGGAVDGESPTTKGTIIQLLFLTIAYIIADLLSKYNVI